AIQTLAPAMRQRLIAQTATRPDRYASRAAIELVVDGLLGRSVIMPRIATPVQQAKAREGAVAVLERVGGRSADIAAAALHGLAAVERWAIWRPAWISAISWRWMSIPSRGRSQGCGWTPTPVSETRPAPHGRRLVRHPRPPWLRAKRLWIRCWLELPSLRGLHSLH